MTLFAIMDVLRRKQGDALQVLDLGPSECTYRVIASAQCWRLRDYGRAGAQPAVLIVAAPIKRPYVWDFTPPVSAVRFCLDQGFHGYLLEWVPAAPGAGALGLDEYADRAIARCIGRITEACHGVKPVLFGHSLGGTFAAMFTALDPHTLSGLVLLGAPLSFKPMSNQLLNVAATIGPQMPMETEIIPGSLLSYASALAWPTTFMWSRWMDVAFNASDRWAMETRARLERWALDEASLPGKLVYQVLYWLYGTIASSTEPSSSAAGRLARPRCRFRCSQS
jgi:polyhydroxyalkanoate synthase